MSKKLLSLALALVMSLSLAAPAMAADEKGEEGKIVILHTNDVHCGIDHTVKDDVVKNMGYAGVAAYKAEMEKTFGESNVTLVDAGDAIQGGNIGTVSKGAYLVDIMNEVGYDLAVPGNHEFDYGMENFLTLAKDKAKYSYICANFTDKDGKAVLDAYKVINYGTVKVAYVGIDTPEAFTKSTPTYFQDANGNYIYSFCEGNNGQDLYAAVQKAVDAAKAEGADYVVAVGHLGEEGTTEEWKSSTVIANTSGIDVLIDGHSHQTIEEKVKNKDGKDVVWAQTGTKLANLGKIVIDTQSGEITAELVPASEVKTPDETVKAYIDTINAQFKEEMARVVATSEVELTTKDASGNRLVRSGETNLGDLCADAYRVVLGADVGLMNGGGVRADIAAGNVTMGNILDVYTFGNNATMAEVTGQQLLDALEFGSRMYPEENGGFLQVSGVTYTINSAVKPSITTTDKKEFVSVDGPYRVCDVKVNGAPLDLKKVYTVGGHDYMLKNGGDGYAMFGKNVKVVKDAIMVDNALLVDYIVNTLEGKITAEKYGKPAGRITIINRPADLDEKAWWYNAAVECLDKNVLNGTDNGFDANATITTATVYQTLYNMEKASVKAEGEWFAPAMTWASEQKLYSGNVASFKDGVIDRKGTMDIMDAYCAMKGVASKTLFKGNESGDMMLDKTLTRAEWAQVLVNLNSAEAAPETPAAPATPETPATPAESEKPTESAAAQNFDAKSLSAKADKEEMKAGELTGFFTNSGKITKRLDDDGSVKSVELAKAAGGAIEFTLTAPATVKVEFSSTGGSNTSSCGIVDASDKAVKEDSGLTTVTGAQTGRTFFTYTNLAAGSYKIVSPADDNNRGARVYSITVE